MGSRDYYKHGDRNAFCDCCAMKRKLSELRKRWDGFMVCSECWEPEHPQNRLVVRPETHRQVEGRPGHEDVEIVANTVTYP